MRRHSFALAVVAGLALVTAACDKGLTEANQNRNAPTDVGPEFLLPQAIRVGVEWTFDDFLMQSHTAIWPQHFVQLQYPDEEEGLVRPDNMQLFWDGYYAGPLKDIQVVIDKGVETQSPNVEAVGTIWKSWLFHIVTDLWGDVPYSEALQAEEGVIAPVYDAQRDIYVGLLNELTAAVAKLTASGAGFGTGDILYDNNVDRWRRFANSLRMRLAMRLSEEDATIARTQFIAAYNAGGFQSNADNAMLEWPGAPHEAPQFENWQGRDDHGISATMVDTLKSFNDPRLELYAEPAQTDGQYRGLGNGISEPPLSIASYSRIGNFWRADGAATPTAVMTYAEVLFLQAEAAARGWIAADAGDLYRQGIIANMNTYDQFGNPPEAPTDAEITAYLALPRVQYNAATGIAQINLQKWIALYMNGTEAWANWRRSGVPNLVKGPDMATARIPVRFSYPSGEQSLNKTNLDAAIARQGGGLDLVTPVWWQK
jgi:hypothetical protein